jgi:anaerobic magnesium-protoporphyrin IX monomethyl ester cyclase
MDILLTHGYFISDDPHEQAVMKPYPPLGILYLSSYLKAAGFDVKVLDGTLRPPAAFRRLLERERPPVVGIYANLITRGSVVRMARLCQELGSIAVVGGPEPANYPEEYLARGADIVVVGEGERTLEELLPHLARCGPKDMEHIRGIVYRREDGSLVRTQPRPFISDLDGLPFPDRAAIDVAAYARVWRERHGHTSISLITARGCPYTCTWCSHAVFGSSHRRRSPRNVADEVGLILESYHPDILWYADDVFTMSPQWLSSYAQELAHRGIRIPFETISREDRLDENAIRTLAEMGCFRLWLGAESGSQRLLDRMERRTDAPRVPEVVRLLQAHGIEAGLFIMLGYEGEEMVDLQATVRMLIDAGPDQFLTALAYPIKGTPYYDQVRNRLLPLVPWEGGSDRDLGVAGRHSRRFYRFATRWMVNQVGSVQKEGASRIKATLNAGLGRTGMWLTRHEVER